MQFISVCYITDISSLFVTVQLVFEQRFGNFPISCVGHPFCVVGRETRHCLHGPKGVRLQFSFLVRFDYLYATMQDSAEEKKGASN